MKIYDNSNLAESYSGLTTPLTASFARSVYREVYIGFCQMMGVEKKTIAKNSEMFDQMVVYIGGRMYYDLTNWYQLVSFLPGYAYNKGFFEEMLGVDKKADFQKSKVKSFIKRWLIYFPKTLWQAVKIALTFILMKRLVGRFVAEFDRTYNVAASKDLTKRTEAQLKKIYRQLTAELVVKWQVPIANDFAVMVSTGITGKLFKKWLPKQDSYKYLYVGSAAPLASLDPGKAIMQIVRAIRKDNDLLKLFVSGGEPKEIIKTLGDLYSGHEITGKIRLYIKKYGDRMPGELKLESKSLNESPEILINIIAAAVRDNRKYLDKNNRPAQIIGPKLSLGKRIIINFFLNWAKRSIALREETRLKRTLIFGFARKLFLELAKRYQTKSLITRPDDIFYLTLEEIMAEEQISGKNFKTLIQSRKDRQLIWRRVDLPRRIQTELSIPQLEDELINNRRSDEKSDESLSGTVVSTGGLKTLAETALTMKEFDPTADFSDKLVVTSHTDPGWSLVFPLIKALIVERGGMLSHAAIVARELDIPCIVGVRNATDLIRTGEKIELNLENGKINKKNA